MPENSCHITQGPPFPNKDEVFTKNTPHKTTNFNTLGDLKKQDKYTGLNYKLLNSFSKLQSLDLHTENQMFNISSSGMHFADSESVTHRALGCCSLTALCYNPAQTLHTGCFPTKTY